MSKVNFKEGKPIEEEKTCPVCAGKGKILKETYDACLKLMYGQSDLN